MYSLNCKYLDECLWVHFLYKVFHCKIFFNFEHPYFGIFYCLFLFRIIDTLISYEIFLCILFLFSDVYFLIFNEAYDIQVCFIFYLVDSLLYRYHNIYFLNVSLQFERINFACLGLFALVIYF